MEQFKLYTLIETTVDGNNIPVETYFGIDMDDAIEEFTNYIPTEGSEYAISETPQGDIHGTWSIPIKLHG